MQHFLAAQLLLHYWEASPIHPDRMKRVLPHVHSQSNDLFDSVHVGLSNFV